jgi:hypothetical protein
LHSKDMAEGTFVIVGRVESPSTYLICGIKIKEK